MKRVNLPSVALVFLSITSATHACEFHDTPMFGAFGANHPMMNKAAAPANEEGFVLKHPRAMAIKVNEPGVVKINYQLPLDYRDAKLEFSSQDDLQLGADAPVAIGQLDGEYALNFLAQSKGTHYVKIRVSAERNGSPYTYVQQVKVVAF